MRAGSRAFQHKPPEQPRQHADRQEEAGPAGDPALAIGGKAAAGHDHMHVRMMRHRRSPGVQHRDDADPGAEMLGIGGDREHRLGRRLEQNAVDRRLVLLGDVGDRGRAA